MTQPTDQHEPRSLEAIAADMARLLRHTRLGDFDTGHYRQAGRVLREYNKAKKRVSGARAFCEMMDGEQ